MSRKPCAPGCTCGKHSRLSTEEREQRKREKNARYYQENREKENARSAAYHRANAETVTARRTAYRQANPEKVREQSARYYQEDPGRSPRWARENPEKISVNGDRRRHGILPQDFTRMWEEQRGCCYLC